MAPPPRPASVHSWWSDSNPPGATISLHPMASRLSKLLHHRQVTALLKPYKSQPLSIDAIQDLLPYLNSKEISASTKVLILSTCRATDGLALTRVLVDENAKPVLIKLLNSPDREVLHEVCCLLAHIAAAGGVQPLIEVYTSSALIALLKHQESAVHSKSLQVLAEISDPSDIEACAGAYAGALPILVTLLQSPDGPIVQWTCRILGNIALHEALMSATIKADPCVPLVALLSHNRRLDSLYALHHISSSSEIGARAVVYANAVPVLSRLLQSDNVDCLQWTCNVLRNIASHRNLVQTMLDNLNETTQPPRKRHTIRGSVCVVLDHISFHRSARCRRCRCISRPP
ncbi:armadillo-type protein [Mycena latifolia]|nr:armadillo-type protein [Mycena latifolia]